MKPRTSVIALLVTSTLSSPLPDPQLVAPAPLIAVPPVVSGAVAAVASDVPQAQPVIDPQVIGVPVPIGTGSSSPSVSPLVDPETDYDISIQSDPGFLPVPEVIPEASAIPLAAAAAPAPAPAISSSAPAQQQCSNNAEWTDCASACPRRCFTPPPSICTAQCVAGCQCKSGYVLNAKGDCVSPMGCFTSILLGIS